MTCPAKNPTALPGDTAGQPCVMITLDPQYEQAQTARAREVSIGAVRAVLVLHLLQ